MHFEESNSENANRDTCHSGNESQKIQIGKTHRGNTHREIKIGKHNSANTDRNITIREILIGKYKSEKQGGEL